MTRDRIHHLRRRRFKPTDWTDWMPLPEYAATHFLSPSSARRRIVRGQIPAAKLGGRWYVRDYW